MSFVLAPTLPAADPPTVIGGGGGGGDAKFMIDAGTIKNDMNAVNMNGREFKFQQAESLSEQGRNAAMAAGASYLSAAMGELPFLPTMPIGIVHLNKAMIEFAQAAADQKVASTNGSYEDRVRAEAGQSGGQQDNGQSAKQQQTIEELKSNKQLQEFFTSKGINGDAFVEDLVKGKFGTDTEGMLRSAGFDTSTMQAEIAELKANPNAGIEAPKTAEAKTADAKGDDNSRVTNSDQGAKSDTKVGASGAAGTPADGLAAAKAAAGGAAGVAGAAGAAQGGNAAARIAALFAAAREKGILGAGIGKDVEAANGRRGRKGKGDLDDDDEGDGEDGVGGAFGATPQALAKARELRRFLKLQKLETLGIVQTRARGNIFTMAHGNFRSFRRWRKDPSPATAAVASVER